MAIRSALTLLALAAACGAPRKVKQILDIPPERTRWEQERIDRAIEEGAVIRGMTKAEVRKARGEPVRKDVVERYGGKVRRWMYPWDEVYFDAREVVVGVKTVY